MAEIGALLHEVFDAQSGKLSDSEEDALVSKINGAFFSSEPSVKERVSIALAARDWNFLEGVLRSTIDSHDAVMSGGITVTAQSVATASVSFAIAEDVVKTYQAIDACEDIPEDHQRELRKLIAEMDKATDQGDAATFSRKAARWLSITADLATVWQAFAPALCKMINVLMSR